MKKQMKKQIRGRKNKGLLLGYAIFFVTLILIIMVSVLIFSLVRKAENDLLTALAMIADAAVTAGICTWIDCIRRKYMVSRPVSEILTATEKIAGGDFSVRLYPKHGYDKYDEYDRIFENLNKMAEELSHNEILRTDFISNVSHEIKTPLAILSNYATLLQEKDLVQEKREEYTRALLSATKRLSDLITNILKLNKLENQVLEEKKEELHLGDFLGEIVLGYEEWIGEKEIDLECDIDDVVYRADRTYMEIVSNNLISNAIKFTPAGGRINISLKEEPRGVVFRVSDTGCGMSPETGARIFDKFYQGDTSHREQGNGLGLALVKKVIDIIGGEIAVESEEGKGSVFTITLKK